MSAQGIIEQIKALPADERRLVEEFVEKLADNSADERVPQAPPVRYMDDATFQAAKERVFEKHTELLRRLAE